jgi:DNA-directed RNA polymerase specialized sigma24 family protein
MIVNTQDFKAYIENIVRKNLGSLPEYNQEELTSECWVITMQAINRWKASRGNLTAWIYTMLSGRMKDLRKKSTARQRTLEACAKTLRMQDNISRG